MSDLLGELRVAFRQWRRRPLVPLTIILTLTAGLGAATAVFAVAWAVLWRPLDAPLSHQLVWIEAQSLATTGQSSPGAFAEWQAQSRTMSALAAIRPVSGALADGSGTDRVRGALVTPSLFRVVGIRPVAGRAFDDAEAQPAAARTLLISHRMWTTRYAADPAVIGRSVTMNGAPATIVGVLPAAAGAIVTGADWWSPLVLDARDRVNTGPRYLDVIGRLDSRSNVMAAREELGALAARLQLRDDDGSALGVAVTPLRHHLTAPYASGLSLLLAGVLALVLIAAANAAALLLTRAADRSTEMALRASIGATRWRIARQLFIEAGMLASVACAAGVVAALWINDLLRAILPADLPRLAEARIDLPAALFAIGLGGATAILIGLIPALRGARPDLQAVLRAGGNGPADLRLRQAFIVSQVAMAVVLGCGAALLVRSARALETAPRGYDATGVFTASITLPAATYRDAATIASAIDRISASVASVPGVTSASASSQLPFAGGSPGADLAFAEDAFTDGVDRQVRIRLVAPDYLSTLGVRVLEGRDITRIDSARSQPVVVINQALATRLASSSPVVGRAVKFAVPAFAGDDGRKVWTVVGVAADSWDRGPRQTIEPEVLLPITQAPDEVFFWISRELQLAVRTAGNAEALAADVRRAVASVDPGIPIGAARTLEARIAEAFSRDRLIAQLLTLLGAAGLAIALLGLAAGVDYQVRRQRRDTAVRLALGASTAGVVAPLVAAGTRLAVIGAVAGVAASLGLAPLIAAMLFGITPNDPVTLAGVAAAVVTVASATAWLVARTAARVDPAELLRS